MERSSKELLHLENKVSTTNSSLETALLLWNTDWECQTKIHPSAGKPITSSVPQSQVLGKVKDFLGVMAEANKRLQQDAKDNSHDYDIEALSGNEAQVIEMDLMLGVADLHTPEAVVAAESAIAGNQFVISGPASSSETDSEDTNDDVDNESDDEDNNNEPCDGGYDKGTHSPTKCNQLTFGKDESREIFEKKRSNKRPKIVVMS
ncbi:hypothetical protein K2173_023927 [Erythroxylum novogranatense]|uniref:Uncharacterized protein n=1 Tax=Erythroxylum novogranatense TaxID=1862640 RepID=A0AAV8TPX8_9ROSI|nr:hypothetical protein K2173_023927 [Erythroxylum novogranatense]